MKLEKVHIRHIKVGDTVLIDGIQKTVCANNIGRDDLLGPTLWGDSHRAGHDLITKVLFR